MALPYIADCTTVFICGPVRSGKTELLKHLCRKMERVMIQDNAAQFFESDLTHYFDDPVSVISRLQENPYYYRICYHPVSDIWEGFDWTSRCMWLVDGSRWHVIDEIHEVCGVQKVHPMMNTYARYSRHRLLG